MRACGSSSPSRGVLALWLTLLACSTNDAASGNTAGAPASVAGQNAGGADAMSAGAAGTAQGGSMQAAGGNAQAGSAQGGSAGNAGTPAMAGNTANAGTGGSMVIPDSDAGGAEPSALATLTAAGACPQFQEGLLDFAPASGARQAQVLMDQNAATLDGPLIFGWHATDGNPEQAIGWFGATALAELKAMGGILVAPTREPGASARPWYYIPQGPGDGDNDLLLMDEIVACAMQELGIDGRRIHAYGMSAGGLMTVQVSYRRSSYIASVVVYSGGQLGDVPNQDPDNKFAAMVVHGGATDISGVDGTEYLPASQEYVTNLTTAGHFAFLCSHDSGHTDPAVLPNAAEVQASAWRFLQDHPYGTTPSPYQAEFPPAFWQGCTQ